MALVGQLPTDVIELCAAVEQAWDDLLSHERRVFPANHNRASSLGHPCTRYLYMQRVRGHEAELPSTQLQGIFREGKVVEQATIRDLQELGLEWVWSERPFIDQAHFISGNLDGGVRVRHGVVVPGEIKSMQGPAWEAVRAGPQGLQDLLNHRSWFVRKYPVQVALYLYLSGEDAGMLVLRDKWFWRLRVVPIVREQVEPLIKEALQKADEVNEAIANATPPPRMEYEAKVCGRCEYRTICLPTRAGQGTAWVDDARLVADMQERERLKEYADRYVALDKSLKDRLRTIGEPEMVVGGQYLARNKSQRKRRLAATGDEYDVQVTTIQKLPRPLVPLRAGKGDEDG